MSREKNRFITGRNGVKIRLNVPESYKIARVSHTPIGIDRIVGIDTESIIRRGHTRLKYLQLYISENENLCVDVEKKNALAQLFDYLLEKYGEHYSKESAVKQRNKKDREAREDKADGRDGRRQTIKPLLLCFFNMNYDIGRLLDGNEVFKRFILFGQDCLSFTWEGYQIEIVYSVVDGGSPSFQWIIKRDKTAIRLYGFDATNYFKQSLSETAKALESYGVSPKIDLDKDLFTRDWYKDAPSPREIADFEEYATRDAKCHKEIYVALSKLLCEIDEYVLNKQGMIGMSAGGSAWRMILNATNKEEVFTPPQFVQEMGLLSYYGGISFSLSRGMLPDISCIDISSAYGHAQTIVPAFETANYVAVSNISAIPKNISWGCLCISGEALDPLYPPIVTTIDNRMVGVYGTFTHHWCTVPEIKIGIARGALRVDAIHYGFFMRGKTEGGLKSFIENMYRLKDKEPKNSPIYIMSKLLSNAPYGKTCEKRKTLYSAPFDEDGVATIVFNIQDKTFKEECKKLYVEKGYAAVYEKQEKYLIDHGMLTPELTPKELRLSEWFDEGVYESGIYFNSALASQITGFTRAKLMAGAYLCHAVQGDTDSLFFQGELPENFHETLNRWGAVTPLTGIGQFDVEADHLKGIFVKKKCYTVVDSDGNIEKSAHHTMHKVDGATDQKKAYLALQEELLENGSVSYISAPKPLSMREAWKRNLVAGEFIREKLNLHLEDSPFHVKHDDGLYYLKSLKDIREWQSSQKRNKN
jgi:DNA polymerase type B, organellar and viral